MKDCLTNESLLIGGRTPKASHVSIIYIIWVWCKFMTMQNNFFITKLNLLKNTNIVLS